MKRKLYPLLFFIGVMLLAFWKVIFHGEFTLLIGRDLTAAYFPWFDVASYWLKKGVVLFWDPYVYAGKAFMGEPQPGIYYPLNWIFMLLPARDGGMNLDGFQALLILDYFLVAYFFYLLARSLNVTPTGAALAGVSFALGGYTPQIYAYVNSFSGFVWMPLVLLFFRRGLLASLPRDRYRWTLLSGISLALTFLPGHHAPTVHTGLLLFFYAVFFLLSERARATTGSRLQVVAILASVALTAALITALQWLPSAEWARHVYRWIGEGGRVRWGDPVPYSVLERTSNLSPQDALSLVLPYVSTSANIYVGAALLFLALIGLLFVRRRDAQFFALGLLLYFVLSWGQFSVLHGWANTFIPGIWFAREGYYYLIPFQACLALLAGWGLDKLLEAYTGTEDGSLKVFVRRAGWVMSLLVVSAGLLLTSLHFLKELNIDHPYLTSVASLATYLCLVGFLLFLLHSRRISPALFGSLMIAVVIVDLASQISGRVGVKNKQSDQENTYVRTVWNKTPMVDYLLNLRTKEYFRIDDPSSVFPPNFGDVWRLEATMGQSVTALVDYFNFRGTGWGPASNASALLNMRYFPSRIPVPGMRRVFEGEPALYCNPRAVPRAFVASRYRSFGSEAEMLGWIGSPLFSPRDTVLLRNQDLSRLPEEFRAELFGEQDGLEVTVVSQSRAAQKEVQRPMNDEEHSRTYVYHAPWGWSVGDEILLRIRPDIPVQHCFVIFNFIATSPALSRLRLELKSLAHSREILVELPAAQDYELEQELPKEVAVDLGPLDAEDYRLFLIRTEACSARIDSLRISKRLPEPKEREAGTATITLFQPNRIRLLAELKRPAFVVLSEVIYPGWEVLVDEKPAVLLAGDHILRTVPVPEGKHALEFRYRSKTFLWGLIISLASLAVIGIALLRTSRN